MKLYTVHSKSHASMFFDYLMPSLAGRFEILGEQIPQLCTTGVYHTEGWTKAVEKKFSMLVRASEREKSLFVYSDADVICHGFGPEDAIWDMADADLACANDGGDGIYCSGFMFIRPCPETVELFQMALGLIEKHGCDQPALNEAITQVPLKTKLLPIDKYSNYGHIAGNDLNGPERLANLPDTVKVFHANYIVGLEEKEKVLAAARAAFANRHL